MNLTPKEKAWKRYERHLAEKEEQAEKRMQELKPEPDLPGDIRRINRP